MLASLSCGVAVAEMGTRIPPLALPVVPLVIAVVAAARDGYRRAASRGRASALAGPLRRASVAALAIAMVAMTWNGVRASANLTLSDPFLVLAAVLALVAVLVEDRDVGGFRIPNWLALPAGVIAAVATVDLLIYGGAVSSALPGFRFAVALLLAPTVIGVVAGGFGALWLIVDCWLISVAVNCAVGVSDYFLHTSLGLGITGVVSADRVAGLTTQAVHLAFVALLALPVIVSRILTVGSRRLRAAYTVVAILAVLALLASGSRGGLVVGAVIVAATPFFQHALRVQARRLVTTAAVLCLVAGPGLLVGTAGFQRLTGASSARASVVSSDAGRRQLARQGLAEVAQNPITGVGFAHVRSAHIVYLEVLASGGILVLAAVVYWFAGSIRTTFRDSRNAALSKEQSALAGGCCAAMTAWAALGMVENELFDRYLFVPCGLGLAVAALSRTSTSAPPGRTPAIVVR